MRPLLFMFSAFLFFLTAACHKKTVSGPSPIPVVRIGSPVPSEGDPYEIENASIVKDTLLLDISYSGGCEEHAFNLYLSGHSKVRDTEEASLLLQHDGHKDACRELITKTLRFDISALKHLSSGLLLVSLRGRQIAYSGR